MRRGKKNPFAPPHRIDLATLRQRADMLRLHMTPQERIVWSKLQNLRMGWLPQQIVAFGIVDFLSWDYLCVLEVDGHHHDEPGQARKDRQRDGMLRRLGFVVRRLSNDDAERYDAVADWKGCPKANPAKVGWAKMKLDEARERFLARRNK